MAQKLGDVMRGMTEQIAAQAGVPVSRITRDPVYQALIARITTIEATMVRQAEQIGRLTVAIEELEESK